MISNSSTFIKRSDSATLYHSQNRLALLNIEHPLFNAIISEQGAQLLSFTPKGQQDWLWLDKNQTFISGEEIIGGIPLCLPWFGRIREPIHGFVRFQNWHLTTVIDDDTTLELLFTLIHQANTQYPYSFTAEHRIRLGISIQLSLTVNNHSTQTMPLSFAWHNYFACEDINQCSVSGLNGLMYFDNTQKFSYKLQLGDVNINAEIDSVYVGSVAQRLQTTQPLTLTAVNAPTCIVWNPYGTTKKLTEHAYKKFICVERGCAFDDTIALLKNQSCASVLNINGPEPT